MTSDASKDPLATRCARALLVLLAALLPFEAPIFRVGPLQITTVELVLYATLAAWGTGRALEVLRSREVLRAAIIALRTETMVQMILLWTLVNFVSAMTAPADRAAAFKFALRSLSGVLVFFAVRLLARHSQTARRLLVALLAGALLSAVTAMIDSLAPRSAPLWDAFRSGHFAAFALSRASGVFAYPTIGAMYWEAAVPLLVVAPFLFPASPALSKRVARVGLVVAILGSALLTEAILASATRSALFGATVAAAAFVGLGWKFGVPVRRTSGGVLATIVLTLALPLVMAGSSSLLGQRLRWWQDDSWFRAEYRIDTTRRRVLVGQPFVVPVTLRNTGTLTWTRGGEKPFRLAQHWVRSSMAMSAAGFDGLRTDLPVDVPPGGVVQMLGKASGPATRGTYRLRWDLVQEEVTWFSERGNAMPELEVDVVSAATGHATRPVASEQPLVAPVPPPPSRPALWRAAVILWRQHPLLGIGPDAFRRTYEAVLSPAPTGETYTDTRIHANSFYFETLADLGLAGLVVLALMMLALFRLVRAHHAAGSLAGLGAGVAAAAFFVHGWLDYFLEFTPLFCLFWMLLGLTAAAERQGAPSPADGRAPAP